MHNLIQVPYVMTGMRNGATVFTVSGIAPLQIGTTVTMNPRAADMIDTLSISVTGSVMCCTAGVVVDDIAVRR
jgi:hypothetical protein